MMSILDAIKVYLRSDTRIVEFNVIACQFGHLLHSGTFDVNGVSRTGWLSNRWITRWLVDNPGIRMLSASHR